MDWKARAALLAAALWWGSLTGIGGLAVPLLFKVLPSAALAGQTAARLFTAQAWLSIGCAMILFFAARSRDGARMDWGRGALAFVIGGMLCAVLAEFGVAPRIVARENLALWHSVGSALYAAQWICALVVLWKLAGGSARGDAGSGPA